MQPIRNLLGAPDMTLFTFFSLLLAFFYAALMSLYRIGWRRLPVWSPPTDYRPKLALSVLVPARNEAAQITDCLATISAQDYPPGLLEILVIDDHSEDGTAEVVEKIGADDARIRLIRLSDHLDPARPIVAYKKKALEIAVAQARGAVIVTTDADCLAPANWLRLLASVFETRPDAQFVTAPVLLHRERGLLQRFQSLDLIGLMGVTGAGIHLGFQRMGNGANMAFRPGAFEAVQGYAGNTDRASGDDLFLMQKVAVRYPDGIFFLKNPEAAVRTLAPAGLGGFLGQRIRWASKNAALCEWPIRLSLALLWLFCCSILVVGLLALFHPARMLPLAIGLAGVKMGADWLHLRVLTRFFGRGDLLRSFLPAVLLHVLYVVFVGAIGLRAGRYAWKGRIVR
ncbi:MAG: glycosyltransferase [Saprospiraceae bacterium]